MILSRRERRARSESLIANLVVGVLALLVLLCIALITPASWTAVVESELQNSTWCETKDLAERVPCLPRQPDQVAARPAKGATAPLARTSSNPDR